MYPHVDGDGWKQRCYLLHISFTALCSRLFPQHHATALSVTRCILNQDPNTASEFIPVSAADLTFSQFFILPVSSSTFSFYIMLLFSLSACHSCLLAALSVLDSLGVGPALTLPVSMTSSEIRNKEAARGVASRSSLCFTLLVSALLRFNFNNLIYIVIISASCLFKFVQDIKSAHPAAIKTNAKLTPPYCSNKSTIFFYLPAN